MRRPESRRSRLCKRNFILGRKTSVDSEISIIDFPGVERRKYRERESKKKRTNWSHKDCPETKRRLVISWMQSFTAPQRLSGEKDIIVVDGGSTDQMVPFASAQSVRDQSPCSVPEQRALAGKIRDLCNPIGSA